VPIFTLPGNRQLYVSFEVFVRPAIRRLRGITRSVNVAARVSPIDDLPAAAPVRPRWVDRAEATHCPGFGGRRRRPRTARRVGRANCFIVFDEDVTATVAGATVAIMRWTAG